jgi:putative ABC transport system permease protein
MRGMQAVLADLRQDVRYAARLLRRNPLFALTAALVLAIGIGATTTIFTVANGLLLRAPAGTAQPDRLVDIYQTEDGSSMASPVVLYRSYREIRQRATRLDGVYAYQLDLSALSLHGTDGAERVFGTLVTTNYFSVLGVPAAAGRLFGAQDSDEPGASPLVVLSHRFWTRRYHADPGIIGTTLQINGQSFTVIGVAFDAFNGTSVVAPDLWVPAAMSSAINHGIEPDWLQVMVGGRLKPGVTRQDAAVEIDAMGRTMETFRRMRDRITSSGLRQPGAMGLRLVGASPIPGNLRNVLAGFLALLIGLVSIVLIIACANIAGVLLARGVARRREIAVRLAMGAGRRRLIRQLLTETLMLFVIGGAAGLLLARILTSMVLVLLPAFPQPVNLSLPLDGGVIAFAIAVSLIAAVLSGLAPALQASRTDVVSALNADSQGPIDRLRLRSVFVIAQVAFSIMLVVAAGLLARALDRVTVGDRGFEPRGVDAVSLDLSLADYTKTTGPLFARSLLDRVRALPGVQSASIADRAPSGGMRTIMGRDEGLLVPGLTPPNGQPFFLVNWTIVEPGYFATLKLPLINGRDFTEADRADSAPVVILAKATAKRLWPGENAVGKYLIWQKGRAELPGSGPVQVTRIPVVGVAREVNGSGPRGETPPLSIYAPMQQRYASGFTLFVRTSDGHRAINEIRTLIAAMDPSLPIIAAQPLVEQLLNPVETQLQVAASVSGSVGLIGLLLAAIGLYGVTAYTVTRRTREIGIRIALGAERRDLIGMVLRQGMSLVGIGSIADLALAAGAGRLLRSLLFGLPVLDPLTFGGAAVLFAIIGLIACYLPARRATQVDAMESLRYE